MFNRILVPLDGSSRAEQALPIAARIARKSAGSVLLLRVFTTLHNFAMSGMESAMYSLEDAMKAERAEVNNYLARIATSDVLEGIGTVPIIAEGSPALHVLMEAKDHEADILVMCSHGDTGLKRWLLGSVAEKVIRHSPIPVLVLREGTGVLAETSPEARRRGKPTLSKRKEINSSVTLNKRNGVWWLSLSYDEEIAVQTEPSAPVVGIDVGIANVITTSTGKQYGTMHGKIRARHKRDRRKRWRK